MSKSEYWLFKWLDEHSATDLESAESLLSNSQAVEDLREKATAASESLRAPIQEGISVLAGRGLDLSGHLDCNAPSCRRRQVDDLFKHVWHYFDNIVVSDGVAHEVSKHWDAAPEQRNEWILSHIRVLLYLKQIGAETLVTFREKPTPCEEHWQKHAKDAGLQRVLRSGEELIPLLAQEAEIKLTVNPNGSADFRFDHPQFEHTVWGTLKRQQIEKRTANQIHRAVAEAVLRRYMAHLTSDVAASHQTKVPLGATIKFHGRLLQKSNELTNASVAFHLQLPILEGVPTETLVKIRHDEQDYFKRFQNRLRLAIDERIKIDSSSDVAKLAIQIRNDLIEPELQKIKDRLAASEKLLLKKSVVGIALGTFATICGLIAGLPPTVTIPAAITPILTMYGQAESKHLEEKRDLSLEDMYFLWQAAQHQPHAK